ncbi:MAG: TrkA family potassium uptake protein [Actinomycetota bacterium]|nr:TrkA family potassium uptake protein [Actinomycetota bacterium]
MKRQQVIVVGLGRFGSAVARELQALGHEVLGVDQDESNVNEIARDVTHAIQLDASDEDALRAAGAGDFNVAVVAMSSNVEASIFATMALKKLGVANVIAKAAGELHGSILERVGADRVVYPEREMGIDVAHTIAAPEVLDYIDLAPDFGIQKMRPPASIVGRTLRELDLSGRHGVTLLALRRDERIVLNPEASERIEEGDELVIAGPDDRLERLGS